METLRFLKMCFPVCEAEFILWLLCKRAGFAKFLSDTSGMLKVLVFSCLKKRYSALEKGCPAKFFNVATNF